MASKIGKTEWIVLYIVMGGIDFIQFVIIECILVWFFGVGAAINEILDPIVGAGFAGYLMWRGVSLFSHFSRFCSIVGMAGIEEMTGGVAQLWVLDVWYIHQSVKKEDAAIQAEMAMQTVMGQGRDAPLNQSEVRLPRSAQRAQSGPLNFGQVSRARGNLYPSAPTESLDAGEEASLSA